MHSTISISIFTVSIILPLLATFSVGLRIQGRRIKHLALESDDYTMISALVVSVAAAGMLAYGSYSGGVGFPVAALTPEINTIRSKILFAHQELYCVAVGLVKVSILLFYMRIFSTGKFPLIAKISIVVTTVWVLLFFLLFLFGGTPISFDWLHKGMPNYPPENAILAQSVTDIIFDIYVLCLPFPIIRSLHMTTRNKVTLCAILLLGLLCVISSIIRLAYAVKYLRIFSLVPSDEELFGTARINLWSVIEPLTSVIAGCLPTLGPLFQGGRSPESLINSIRSYLTNRSQSTISSTEKRKNSQTEGRREPSEESRELRRNWLKQGNTTLTTIHHSSQSEAQTGERSIKVEQQFGSSADMV